MLAGFDYGSANCALAICDGDKVKRLPIGDGGGDYLMSVVYALDVSFIAEAVLQRMSPEQAEKLAPRRSAELARAKRMRRELDLTPDDQCVFLGEAALKAYLETPGEGFFVRSPKSFLGASGLRPEQLALFEDIVTLMMLEVKHRADTCLGAVGTLNQVVIGRPVNFQGIGGETANYQAQEILASGARRAGFSEVAFLLEPLAAAFDFEASLEKERRVLVVDVGGGTTDCSMVVMGPGKRNMAERQQDCLGHSGQRIGGNDLDIALAMACLMPHYGLGDLLKSGKPMPRQIFWQAVAINDISAQRQFVSVTYGNALKELLKDACNAVPLQRLASLRHNQQHFQLVKAAEMAKIALSECSQVEVTHPGGGLSLVTVEGFDTAIEQLLQQLEDLMLAAAGRLIPDIIYITGGTSRCPSVSRRIASVYPGVPLVYGDHFGSVTAGLARRAALLFAGKGSG